MGQIRTFRCSSCDYRSVVAGGEDRGLNRWVQTIVCTDCQELHDVTVRRFQLPVDAKVLPDPNAKVLVASWVKFRIGEANRGSRPPSQCEHLAHYWKPVAPRCPLSAAHRVKPWFGMHLPLEEDHASGRASLVLSVSHDPTTGNCPKCNAKMIRSQPHGTWS